NTNDVKCWGYNLFGQLGQENTTSIGGLASQMGDNLSQINLGTGLTATAIRTSMNATCALLNNNSIKCWGNNADGQLGRGNTTNVGTAASSMGDNLASIDVGTGRTVNSFAMTSSNEICAILDNSDLKCWGMGTYGGLGHGLTSNLGDNPSEMGDNLLPVDLGTGLTIQELGPNNTCALFDTNE